MMTCYRRTSRATRTGPAAAAGARGRGDGDAEDRPLQPGGPRRRRAGRASGSRACPRDRLLNPLHYVKWYLDGTLTFRRSCAHGVCGSDAMRINGVNRLACKVLMRDLLPKKAGQAADHHHRADPGPAGGEGPRRRHGAVLRRLPRGQAVPDHQRQPADQGAHPEPDRPGPLRRHHQVHPVRLLHHDLPGVLDRRPATSARPRSSTRTGSSSTAATRRAAERLDILNDVDGVWRCRTTFNCTEACPRGIQVTKAIQEVKRALMFAR